MRISLEKINSHNWLNETQTKNFVEDKSIEKDFNRHHDLKINKEAKKKEKFNPKIGKFKRMKIKFCLLLIKIKTFIEIQLITTLNKRK